jgi:hypothetical protein
MMSDKTKNNFVNITSTPNMFDELKEPTHACKGWWTLL